MAELIKHVAHLTQEIGARPAGTNEEQQAALYIADQMQTEAGLNASLEDFNGSPSMELIQVICCIVSIVFAVAMFFLPVLGFVAALFSIAAAALFVLESYGRPLFSKVLARNVSQNVVAKYVPSYSSENGGTRRRKIILVARYDSGKVQVDKGSSLVRLLPVIQWVELGAMVFLPVVLLLRNVFFLNTGGAVATVFNVLVVIALLILMLPIVFMVLHKIAPYNEAANCNASGVAVLIEVAARIARGTVVHASDNAQNTTVIHGETAAYNAGVVAQGAEIVYEAEFPQEPSSVPESSEERLSAAKAAVAALSGVSVSESIASTVGTVGKNLVQINETLQPSDTEVPLLFGVNVQEEGIVSEIPNGIVSDSSSAPGGVSDINYMPTTEEGSPSVEGSVPDWFKRAQEQAKKPRNAGKPAQRSHYAAAFEALESEADEGELSSGVLSNISADGFTNNSLQGEETQGVMGEEKGYLNATEMEVPAFSATNEPQIPSFLKAFQANSHDDLKGDQTTTENQGVVTLADSKQEQQTPISLPNIDIEGVSLAPIMEAQKQRAPLADIGSPAKKASRNLRSLLPSINLNRSELSDPVGQEAVSQEQKEKAKVLLPAFSGSIFKKPTPEEKTAVNTAGSFANAGDTGLFEPLSDDVFKDVNEKDLYIEDADDSAYEQEFTETGAYTGTGYVEMPKSRIQRLFGRFSRKKKQEETTAGEWLDVSDSFDAREVGAQRGGWESFREDNASSQSLAKEEYEGFGGFEGDSIAPEGEKNNQPFNEANTKNQTWNGGAFSTQRFEMPVGGFDNLENPDALSQEIFSDPYISHEIQEVEDFQKAGFSTEVWFVALGSELSQNSGMQAFLAEHQQDLRGSIIIELDALGAGDLCMVESEGVYKTVKTSSRMKRYIKKASKATSTTVGGISLPWNESASSFAAKKGLQAMHLVGVKNNKPAYYAQADDVFECVKEESLEKNASFVVELLKNI